jgi:hypothetical protein
MAQTLRDWLMKPEEPSTDQKSRNILDRLRLNSRHNQDLKTYFLWWLSILIAGFLVICVACVLIFYYGSSVELFGKDEDATPIQSGASAFVNALKVFVPFFGGMLAIFVTIVHRIYDSAIERLSTVELFFAEISSICSAIYVWRIVGQFREIYHAPFAYEERLFIKRSGNYVEIFTKSSERLGRLDRDLVRDTRLT